MTLFHLLRSSSAAWKPFQAEGTVFGSINRDQLAKIKMPMIVESRREPLERELSALERRIAAALGESELLATLRDTLLPQLLSGKLRVPDRRSRLRRWSECAH
jgi:type I restriction enzyme, S subunit